MSLSNWQRAASESATEHKPQPLLQHDAASGKPEPYERLHLFSHITMRAIKLIGKRAAHGVTHANR